MIVSLILLCKFLYTAYFIKRHAIPYSFVEASKYNGPIVEGWPPSKNRSTELYMKGNDSVNALKPLISYFKNSYITTFSIF